MYVLAHWRIRSIRDSNYGYLYLTGIQPLGIETWNFTRADAMRFRSKPEIERFVKQMEIGPKLTRLVCIDLDTGEDEVLDADYYINNKDNMYICTREDKELGEMYFVEEDEAGWQTFSQNKDKAKLLTSEEVDELRDRYLLCPFSFHEDMRYINE